uniref:Uncharacterized protein n=1 Tax=Cacopsylla melanoneura TaxID=428564 RepID=A0A8D8WH09_9HEMI
MKFLWHCLRRQRKWPCVNSKEKRILEGKSSTMSAVHSVCVARRVSSVPISSAQVTLDWMCWIPIAQNGKHIHLASHHHHLIAVRRKWCARTMDLVCMKERAIPTGPKSPPS